MTTIGIILGSTRPERLGEQVARWVHDTASSDADAGARFELIDLRDHPLPHLDEPLPAARGQYHHEHTKAWAATIDRVKVVNFTFEGILAELPFLYKEQQLPDSLPHHLAERMSTDVPLGDLQLEEEVWDEERVRQDYARFADAGRTPVDTFAFAPDGSVAGYTQTTITSDPSVVYQQDTLVLREHRGNRLGLRLKAANTLALMDQLPGPAAVRTWNAEENAPMLSVNRGLGYRITHTRSKHIRRL